VQTHHSPRLRAHLRFACGGQAAGIPDYVVQAGTTAGRHVRFLHTASSWRGLTYPFTPCFSTGRSFRQVELLVRQQAQQKPLARMPLIWYIVI